MDGKNVNASIPDLLHGIYQEKKKKNQKFSLRAFARDIGVPPGRLSEIMAGKRNLTLNMAQKFADAYQLGDDAKSELFSLVKSQTNLRTKQILDQQFIPPQEFEKICHWKFYALIYLIQNSASGITLATLAESLGLDATEIQNMLLTLKRLKLVNKIEDRYFAPKIATTTSQEALNKSIRKFQKEMLEFHLKQLDAPANTEHQEAQTVILSFSKSKIKHAKTMIKNCLSTFEKKFSATHTNDLFSLSVQLSPLKKD